MKTHITIAVMLLSLCFFGCATKPDGVSTLAAPCLGCPEVGTRYNSLDEDDNYAAKITAWNTFVSQTPAISTMENLQGFYITKKDLLKLMCSQYPDTVGIAIRFGMMGDGTPNNPRKLMPYVSGAKMNVSVQPNPILGYDFSQCARICAPGVRFQ